MPVEHTSAVSSCESSSKFDEDVAVDTGIRVLCSSGEISAEVLQQLLPDDGNQKDERFEAAKRSRLSLQQLGRHDKPKDHLFEAAKQTVFEECSRGETFMVDGVERFGRFALDDDSTANGATTHPAKPRKRGEKIKDAIALLSEHPDWPDKKIAERAGCSPSNLSMSPHYRAIREAIRRSGRKSHSASRNARTGEIDFSSDC